MNAVDVAKTQVGVCESPAGSNDQKYGHDFGMNGVAWCSEFVWWCFAHAYWLDMKKTVTPNFASCGYARDAFKAGDGGRLVARNAVQPNDIVYYDWNGDGWPDHTGIVVAMFPDHVVAIEGNTSGSNQSNGGMVMLRSRGLSVVNSFARPNLPAVPPTVNQPPAGQTVINPPSQQAQDAEAAIIFALACAKLTVITALGGEKPVNGKWVPLTPDEAKHTVTIMQMALNRSQPRLSFYGQPVTVREDGVLDAHTLDALKIFQQTHGLVADGICGPAVWTELLHP